MPIELTPETQTVAALEQGGEHFEVRRYERAEGRIDVVRYAADGTIVEKHTFTWDSEYGLWEAKLSHLGGDDFELEILAEHWKGCMPLRETFRFSRKAPKKSFDVTKWFEEGERKTAESLAAAEQKARETGKEPFDLKRLEELLNRGRQERRERQHRVRYYVLCPELKTLADYAKLLLDEEPWEDTR